MKPLLPVLFILVCLVCFYSCSRTIHTQQALQSPHTKDDVLKQFGPPTKQNKVTESKNGFTPGILFLHQRNRILLTPNTEIAVPIR